MSTKQNTLLVYSTISPEKLPVELNYLSNSLPLFREDYSTCTTITDEILELITLFNLTNLYGKVSLTLPITKATIARKDIKKALQENIATKNLLSTSRRALHLLIRDTLSSTNLNNFKEVKLILSFSPLMLDSYSCPRSLLHAIKSKMTQEAGNSLLRHALSKGTKENNTVKVDLTTTSLYRYYGDTFTNTLQSLTLIADLYSSEGKRYLFDSIVGIIADFIGNNTYLFEDFMHCVAQAIAAQTNSNKNHFGIEFISTSNSTKRDWTIFTILDSPLPTNLPILFRGKDSRLGHHWKTQLECFSSLRQSNLKARHYQAKDFFKQI